MNVGELKAKLESLDDDLEIFVSPLVEMAVLDEPEKILMPTPFQRYKLNVVCQSGALEDEYKTFLLLGFGNVNFGTTEEKKEFIN